MDTYIHSYIRVHTYTYILSVCLFVNLLTPERDVTTAPLAKATRR